jgi:hypothetical protein
MTNGDLIEKFPAATSIVRLQKKNAPRARDAMIENLRAGTIDIAKIDIIPPNVRHRSGRCLPLQ